LQISLLKAIISIGVRDSERRLLLIPCYYLAIVLLIEGLPHLQPAYRASESRFLKASEAQKSFLEILRPKTRNGLKVKATTFENKEFNLSQERQREDF
jgi:hypothetical protein